MNRGKTETILRCIPQPLLDDIIAGRCLPVIGAGFSRNAILPSGKTMPLWNDLGKEIADLLPNYPYTNAIDAISAYCHEYSRTKLVEELIKMLFVNSAQPSPCHLTFCDLFFNIVCTTNIDFLIENAYAQKPQSKYCRPVIDEDELSVAIEEPSVLLIKLHGDLHHPNRLVLTEEDYDGFIKRYSLLATYLGNLLITRTPLFIGYSLDDPDFRQIWQVIGDRLGKMRRPAYVISVGANQVDIARYERRGVKVINLPGNKKNYAKILEVLFNELRVYWSERTIKNSTYITKDRLDELSLPIESTTSLCFFAIPLSMHTFYKSFVFPMAEQLGLTPLTASDVVSPGDNTVAKISALLDRTEIMIADLSTSAIQVEVGMLISRRQKEAKVLLIVEEGTDLPVEFREISHIIRPKDLSALPQKFLESIENSLQELAKDVLPLISEEPQRLLEKKEYAAAVISVTRLFEITFREITKKFVHEYSNLAESDIRPLSITLMMDFTSQSKILDSREIKKIREAIRVRNRLLHEGGSISSSQATRLVSEILQIVSVLRKKFDLK